VTAQRPARGPLTTIEFEDEETWLRHRVIRLHTILRLAQGAQIESELKPLIRKLKRASKHWHSGAQPSAPAASSQQSQSTTSSPGDEISPQKLNAQQVRQLQQSLNDKGFNVGAVDSEWGPRTEEALKKFQESKSMPSTGQLNESTISALGLNGSDFGLSHGNSQTTGQALRSPQNSRRW
jgi:hypothetical protein